jgi:hypothetical protein
VVYGGRVELRLGETAPESVDYRVTLTTAEGQWSGWATVGEPSGGVELKLPSGDPGAPPWLYQTATRLLRTAWRNRQRDPGRPWPRRISRWRPGPQPPDSEDRHG